MSNKKLQIRNSTAEFLIFTSQTSENTIEVRVQDGTVWLTQQKISDLFGVDRTVITKHLKNIFETQELNPDSVCAIFAHTEFSSNSAVLNILFKCLVTTERSEPNSSAIAFCVSQNVPLRKCTDTLASWSVVLNSKMSFGFIEPNLQYYFLKCWRTNPFVCQRDIKRQLSAAA